MLDLSMPDLDGVEVLQRLTDDPMTRNRPVVVYTARDLSTAERSSLAGQTAAIVTESDGASYALRDAVRLFLLPAEADATTGRASQ